MSDVIFSQNSIFYAIINLITLYVYKSYYDTIFIPKNKIIKQIIILVYSLCFLIFQISFLIITEPLLNLFLSLSLNLLLTCLYKGKLLYKIFSSLIIVITMVGIEIFTPFTYSLITNIDVNYVLSNDNYILFMTAVSRLIPLILVKIFQYFRKNNKINENINISISYWIRLIIIPIFSIFIMHTLFVNSKGSNWYIVISVLLVLIINALFYYLYEKILEQSKAELENILLNKQIEYYSSQYMKIEENWNSIRVLKHNLKHRLIAIQSKIIECDKIDIDDIKQEVIQIINEMDFHNMQIYTDNIPINTILNYEIDIAKQNDINVDLNVSVRDNIKIDGKLLCVILGNILDNAIEATIKLNQDKDICIDILEEKGNLYINVTNMYKGEIYFENDLPKSNKKDKLNHGIGLISVKKIIDELDGYMQITTDDNVFSVEIIIFNATID